MSKHPDTNGGELSNQPLTFAEYCERVRHPEDNDECRIKHGPDWTKAPGGYIHRWMVRDGKVYGWSKRESRWLEKPPYIGG